MHQEKKQEVLLNEFSQDYVLQQRMKEKDLAHGDRVTADIGPVRLERQINGAVHMYFCPLQSVDVTARIESGDDAELPSRAKLLGVEISANCKPGYYMLKDVQLFSNGTLQVIATEQTEIVESYC